MATQEERWMARYRECLRFLEEEGRKPSKHYPEERNLRSWWKHNKKLYNAGKLKPERLPLFQHLIDLNAACLDARSGITEDSHSRPDR